VVTPERLPVWETEKAVEALSRHGVPVGAIIVNQVLPDPEPGVTEAAFVSGRRARQAECLARISEGLGDWPVLRVRLQDTDPVGVDALQRIRPEVME